MTVAPVPGHAPASKRSRHAHGRLARLGVVLAAFAAVAIAASFAVLGVGYAIGGSGAIEDNWVGYLAGFSLLGGLPASLAAFTLALAAKLKHERWPVLWFPLSLFPALVALLMLGEAFLWE